MGLPRTGPENGWHPFPFASFKPKRWFPTKKKHLASLRPASSLSFCSSLAGLCLHSNKPHYPEGNALLLSFSTQVFMCVFFMYCLIHLISCPSFLSISVFLLSFYLSSLYLAFRFTCSRLVMLTAGTCGLAPVLAGTLLLAATHPHHQLTCAHNIQRQYTGRRQK